MFSDLSIIIINYNLKKDTADCIRSFLTAGASLSQIILVDNGSSDDSASYLRNEFGFTLRIIEAKEVKGYAHGLNLGIEMALQNTHEWLLLMSNDTIVAPDFINAFDNAVHQTAEYSIMGPMIRYFDFPDKIWFLGNQIVPGTMIAIDPFRMKPVHSVDPELFKVDFLNGCCLLVNQRVFKEIGLFDASFFMYAEEVDFLWRARKSGILMAAAPKANMWHKVSATMNQDKPGSRYLRIRNQIWVYRRYANFWQLGIMFSFTFFRLIRLLVIDLFRHQLNLINPLFKGFRDGWFGSIPMRTK